MANGTQTDISQDGSVIKTTYNLTTADHTGAAMPAVEFETTTIQATGTFGGATLQAEGSMDGTNFFALNDNFGDSASFTSAGISSIAERAQYIRPRLSSVGSGADIDVVLMSNKTINTRIN